MCIGLDPCLQLTKVQFSGEQEMNESLCFWRSRFPNLRPISTKQWELSGEAGLIGYRERILGSNLFRSNRQMSANKNADSKLVQSVTSKLSMRGFRPPSNVQVACANGQVTLTGTVPLAHLKLSAAQVAQGVTGVKRVVNQITVKAPERKT